MVGFSNVVRATVSAGVVCAVNDSTIA
jgi:hypothetical protein